MASVNSSGFARPLPFLKSTPEGLELDEETAEIVSRISQPVVVIVIAGKYRTGKSYILNLLCDLPKNSGFALGDTVESFTKGIWIYALPHPKLENTTLILLDTEGLGDVERGDINYDTTLLVLSILLSSTFILNVTGRLDDEVITQLGFVSQLTKSMKIRDDDDETGDDFAYFFPQLIVLVRDFCLQLRIKGKEISANNYFNNYCLQLQSKSSSKSEKYNEPRKLIMKYFPKRNCVTLPLPVFSRKLLQQLETVSESQMNPEFVEECEQFIQLVLDISQPKTITERARVNGGILVTLLRNYLDQIVNGAVPCIETTLQSTARQENEKLLIGFIAAYKEKMKEKLDLPTSLMCLTEMHQSVCFQLTEDFKQRIIFDGDKNEMEKQYTSKVNNLFNEIMKENEEISQLECEKRLQEVCAKLNEKLDAKAYYKSGGYNEYSRDLYEIIEEYNSIKERSIMHEEVLCKFVADRYREGIQISQLDEQVTDAEKKIEAARLEKEHAEQIAKMEKAHAEHERKAAEEMKRTFEQTRVQMEREMKERADKHDELMKLIAASLNRPPPPPPESSCQIL